MMIMMLMDTAAATSAPPWLLAQGASDQPGIWASIVEGKNLFWILLAAFGVVAVLAHYLRSTLVARAREKTNRELFAYVAGGSIDPEHATAMLKAAREVDKLECDEDAEC